MKPSRQRGWVQDRTPERFVDLAGSRCSGLLEEIVRYDRPPSVAVRSAYLQGASDMALAIESERKKMDQKPSIGRIVHYQAYGTPGGEFPSVPRAACITAVHSDTDVEVFVMNPQGVFFNRVQYSDTPKPGHWNWPPRV